MNELFSHLSFYKWTRKEALLLNAYQIHPVNKRARLFLLNIYTLRLEMIKSTEGNLNITVCFLNAQKAKINKERKTGSTNHKAPTENLGDYFKHATMSSFIRSVKVSTISESKSKLTGVSVRKFSFVAS